MKISVIGLGFVGLSLASVLASKGFKVVGLDIDKTKCTQILNGTSPFFEPGMDKMLKIGLKKGLEITNNFSSIINSDLVFVTVGTPQKKDGSIELTMIKNAVKNVGNVIAKCTKSQIVLIKSTVIPGTMQNVILPILEKHSHKKAGKDFGLISNPEFLQESRAIKDTKFPHVIVLGGYKTKFMKKIQKFLHVLHPNTPIIITNHQTAELIKYANNSFLATKISFINQLANICENVSEANIDDIAKAIGLDPRIGNLFLNAGPGYGGSCLPKDMKAIIKFSNRTGITPTLLNAVEKTNEDQIDSIIGLMKKALGRIESKNITVLGTAFKPNTDDIRNSIAIKLIKKILKMKGKVRIHDPKAMENTRKIFGNKIEYAETLSNALKNSHCAVIMTQWTQYKTLNDNSIKNMRKKLIVDCRRMLKNKKLDADYYAIGIGKN
jgi:UDPglucose 6-dehydrogenase